MRNWNWLSLILTLMVVPVSYGRICPRDKSRVVAKVVQERIIRALGTARLNLSPICKFSLERNMFSVQEGHKVFEAASRWTCNFCGKSFVSEFFLDRHFENRHEDQVLLKDAVCLADVCDVFRCDIISGVSQPDYWDIALCLEDDMEELLSECKTLVEECIPPGLTTNETETLRNRMMESVCSFLTCSKFWNTPYQEEENSHTVLYVILTSMTLFGITVYTFIFYNYFYSEQSEFAYDPAPKTKHKMKKYRPDMGVADITNYSRHRADLDIDAT